MRVALRRMRSPVTAYLGLSLLWGSGWMLRASTPAQPPLRSLAIQYGISAVLLLPSAVRRRLWRKPTRDIAKAVIVGIGILCLPQLLIFSGSGNLSPAISLCILAAVPVLLAITGRLTITSAVVGLAGVVFLADRGLNISLRQLPWMVFPLMAAVMLAWALAAAERYMQTLSIAEALFGQCGACAMLLFIASLFLDHTGIAWSVTAAVGFAMSAVLMTISGYLLFYWLLDKLGAGRASTLQWSQPLVAALESMLLMRERPDWTVITGTGLIVIAIVRAFSDRQDDGGVIFEITRS